VIRLRAGAAAFVACLLLAACGSSPSDTARDPKQPPSTTAPASASTTLPTPTTIPLAPPDFAATDAALEVRVSDAGLSGGMIRIARADGTTVHEHATGDVSGTTSLGVASSAKWLTAATFMTFVDQGVAGLDDDISRWLPEFAGSSPAITPRQLLTHTSGVRDHACQSNGTSLSACVQQLATSPREFTAGTQFSYGNAPFLVVGRLIEVLGGADFATVVQQRITGPLGMGDTTWPGAPAAPNPAYGLQVTVDDYGRFLDMILNRGVARGTRLLSADAVTQLVSDQVAGFDTTHDYSVGITRIPHYALGAWVDVETAPSDTDVVSGNGGMGFYPWVDYSTGTWGVVGVQDTRGAEVAVPASQAVELEARRALTG
jgi:CubicO group peptidase (beta-lactamase class C family)